MSRITPGTVIVGIFAVLFGLVGAYGVRKYLQSGTVALPPPAGPRLTVVPLASADLEAGKTIVLDNVALMQLTSEDIAKMRKSGKLPAQFMTSPSQIIGRILKTPLKQGDAFKTEDLYPTGAGPTIAERLAPGLRAVTISVDGTGALGGYDGPGSYVDIVFRTTPDDKSGIPETTVTLLEGVQVLAIEEADRRAPPGARLENRVTLAVTADQANALKIAEGRGTFALSLRNPEDVEVATSTVPQTLDRLLNLPVANQHVTAIFRGGNQGQTASFAGAPVQSPPAVSLPVAGVLQLRAAQMATSVESEEPEADEAEEAAVQEPPPPPKPAASARPSQPVKAVMPTSQRPNGSSANTPPAPSGVPDTVTLQIPVSVLLGAGVANVHGAQAGNPQAAPALPSAAPMPASPLTAGVADASRSTRQRKMLSDVGRDYWDKLPKYRSRN